MIQYNNHYNVTMETKKGGMEISAWQQASLVARDRARWRKRIKALSATEREQVR